MFLGFKTHDYQQSCERLLFLKNILIPRGECIKMNIMPPAAAAPTTHNDDQHPCEGSSSGDSSSVDDRRRYTILPTPQQN